MRIIFYLLKFCKVTKHDNVVESILMQFITVQIKITADEEMHAQHSFVF